MTRARSIFFLLILSCLLPACEEQPVNISVNISATVAGRPAAGARIAIDGNDIGVTDEEGKLSKKIQRLRSSKVKISALLKTETLKAKPWEDEFTIAANEKREGGSYDVNVVMQTFITIAAQANGAPLANAGIRLGDKALGTTGKDGNYEYVFSAWPEGADQVQISKAGYITAQLAVQPQPGATFSTSLVEQAVVRISASSEQYGRMAPLAGARVLLDDQELGTTDERGKFTYLHFGTHGGTAQLKIVAAGQIPPVVEDNFVLTGPHDSKLRFYPATAAPLRVGIYDFTGKAEAPGQQNVVADIQSAFTQFLFRANKGFQPVPGDALHLIIEESGQPLDTLLSAGWEATSLRDDLDILVAGNVVADGGGFLIETRFHRFDGKLLFGHIARAASGRTADISRAVAEIISNLQNRFPLAGTITGVDSDGVRINLGTDSFPISAKDYFAVYSMIKDSSGLVTGSRMVGALQTKSVGRESSLLTLSGIKKGDSIKPGDMAVRIDLSMQDLRSYATLRISNDTGGGVPLSQVNVFMDGVWIGQSKNDGKINAPAKRGTPTTIILTHPGFKLVKTSVTPKLPGQEVKLAMQQLMSRLQVSSEPAGAKVYVDGTAIGTTPMGAAVAVATGFHLIKLDDGETSFPWSGIREFGSDGVMLTDKAKITLLPDLRKVAAKQLQSAKPDAAVSTYQSSTVEHPDYIAIRSALAEHLLDRNKDADGAIKEIEHLLSARRIDHIVNKTYNSVFIIFGRAYSAKAAVVKDNSAEAALYYLKAVEALTRARDSADYFPAAERAALSHDAYFHLAMARHQLHLLRPDAKSYYAAQLAWQEYLDAFPEKLKNEDRFAKAKQSAYSLREELKPAS